MATNVKLKEVFEVDSKYGAFYTGGNVEWHGDVLYCQTASSISLLNVEDGVVSKTVGEENSEDADNIQTFTTDGEKIVSSHNSGLLKLWNSEGELLKIWKYIHKGPIAKLLLKDNKMISGGADSTVRVWNLNFQTCLFSLKGCQGVVNLVEVDCSGTMIFASGDDGKVHSWELETGNFKLSYNGHYSKVTSLVFAHDNKHFVTSGRDKVVILWELGQPKSLRTISMYESIEVILGLPLKFKLPGFKNDPENIYVASGGESGVVRIWDVNNSKEIFKQTNSLVSKVKDNELAIISLLCNEKSKTLAIISADQNIILHHLKSFACLKQFVGFSDEILDITFVGKHDTHLAVATNSRDIKLYHNTTMNCQLLKGHTEIVLALNTSKANPDLLVSSAKDNQIRLWLMNNDLVSCVGVGMRHTGSVGSVAFSNSSTTFLVSGSRDTCLKLWQIPSKFEEGTSLNCTRTEIAHQKDINCVTVATNDKLIASSSQDKTAKLWTDTLSLVGTLRGHKRGVWSVRFSPVDQVVITSSADCTIKLWSVGDLSCLITLEEHQSSVLKVEFISNGMQILSISSDGLMKLINVKTSKCVATFDQHDGRIWALAINNDESSVVTGGTDSLLIKWKDVTEERKLNQLKEEEETILQLQKLDNYLQSDKLLKALKLALRLDRPLQVLRIIKRIILKGDTTGLADAVKDLRDDEKESLLKCATNWNTNNKHCQSTQLVLNILIREMQCGDFKPVNLRSFIEETLPYTERHFKRLSKRMKDLNLTKFTINCMQPLMMDI